MNMKTWPQTDIVQQKSKWCEFRQHCFPFNCCQSSQLNESLPHEIENLLKQPIRPQNLEHTHIFNYKSFNLLTEHPVQSCPINNFSAQHLSEGFLILDCCLSIWSIRHLSIENVFPLRDHPSVRVKKPSFDWQACFFKKWIKEPVDQESRVSINNMLAIKSNQSRK